MTTATALPTLAEARAAIPDHCRQRSRARSWFSVIRDVVAYVAVLAVLVWSPALWITLPLIALAGLLVVAMFVLGHDASHHALFDSDKLNHAVARVLMLPSLHLESAWDLGHNRIHHGYTARRGMDFIWQPLSVEEYAALSNFERLRHRLEWSWAGAGLYYLRAVWWNKMIRFTPPRKWVRVIRRDYWIVGACALVASIGAAALGWWRDGTVIGAVWMWTKLLAAPFLVFTQFIGWTVYVHHVDPDLKWWSPRTWTPWHGQMESTTVIPIPFALNVFFHNIFVHVPHHADPGIPWYRLPEADRALRAAFPDVVVERPLRLSTYLRATRTCKLYDWDTQTWLPYDAVDAMDAATPIAA